MSEHQGGGMDRRTFLRRAAVTTAAAAWATPVIQTIGMGRASAQSTTPCSPGISFIAVNVVCGTSQTCIYLKYELSNGSWVCDPGLGEVVEQCDGFTPCEPGDEGTDCSKVSVSGNEFSATITADPGCTILDIAVKGGQCCDVFNGVNTTSETVRCPTNC